MASAPMTATTMTSARPMTTAAIGLRRGVFVPLGRTCVISLVSISDSFRPEAPRAPHSEKVLLGPQPTLRIAQRTLKGSAYGQPWPPC